MKHSSKLSNLFSKDFQKMSESEKSRRKKNSRKILFSKKVF